MRFIDGEFKVCEGLRRQMIFFIQPYKHHVKSKLAYANFD